MAERGAWLMLAAGDDREFGGNDGYDDDPDVHYSWDNTVNNHARVLEGDYIVLWDKRAAIGASVIENIDTWDDEKFIRRCPECGTTAIKPRKFKSPRYRCDRCQKEFHHAATEVIQVTKYRTRHDAGWVHLDGCLTAEQLRRLCVSPKSQHSLRPLRWEAFRDAVQQTGRAPYLDRLDRRTRPQLPGGHRRATVRVRVGQAAFRDRLLSEHGSVCAFTGPAPEAVLEAAHLYSYATVGTHHWDGGLLLRRDIHRLFDDGDLAVHPASLSISVGEKLAAYADYRLLDGKALHARLTVGHRTWLQAHYAQHRSASDQPDGKHATADLPIR